VRDGIFDFWEICRPLLADPDLIHKAAEDRLDEVRPCIGSLNCLSRLFRDLPYTCTMNPALGHEVEPEYQVTPAAVKKKVMVIGAGPAGMECAITATKRGHEVTVFDKAARIGGNLYAYAMNDLARPGDLLAVISHYEVMAKKLGLEIRLNTEVHAKFMRSVLHQYDVCVVAAGARIDRTPFDNIEGANLMLDAFDVAHGRVAAGKRVVVIGGGKIGLAVAEALRKNQGAQVTVVEKDKRIAGDVMPSFKWRHASWVEELGIPCLTLSRPVRVTEDGVTVRDAKGVETFVPADTVILAAGAKPAHELLREFEWMVDELYGVGDALIPRGLEQAIQEGFRLGVRL
jgi:NADPH-dependent 2,4-dienoyl-CoA reductase/sulfur reductase-like enzyme